MRRNPKMTYEIDIAGLKRDLPLCPLNDQLSIAGLVRGVFAEDFA